MKAKKKKKKHKQTEESMLLRTLHNVDLPIWSNKKLM
jgi:hypothetical protein